MSRPRKYPKNFASNTSLYRAWVNMRQRCTNRNLVQYKDWGGRGIKVCDRWLGDSGFSNFIKDMGSTYQPGLTLDRIDNDGNYEPSNCRWATRREQQSNRRKNRMVTFNGETKTFTEWANIMGVPIGRARLRVYRYKWDDIRALEMVE